MAGPAAPAAPAGAPWTSLTDILFDFDKSDVRSSEKSKVDKVVQYMKDNPNSEIGLDGFADQRGSEGYNKTLSQHRVEAVKQALVAAGAPAARIRTASFGETRPRCNESTENCWQQNRRVEVLAGPGR